MPFSFQLLVEFFFPGLILLSSFLLFVSLLLQKSTSLLNLISSYSDTDKIIFVFIMGLLCYFLGAIINGVSNKFIRIGMAPYRRSMIRRKLGLGKGGTTNDLSYIEKKAIEKNLPRLKSKNKDDELNELYAAARTYSVTTSDRAGKLIDYHWSLVRLSRATLLPLGVLITMFLLRWKYTSYSSIELIGLVTSLILFILTLINYRYREKFLVYTTFDIFFIFTIPNNRK